MTLVVREDLSRRTALSKSALQTFDLCQTKSWYQTHDPRPFVTNEKVSFGSAVDAGVEVVVKLASSGQPYDRERASEAAAEIIQRDGWLAEHKDVMVAVDGFANDVVPRYDWNLAITQASITATLDGLGECNGHPDVVMGDGSVRDVKTAGRAKDLPSLELGFYVLLMEATGATVPTVGYWNWVRLKKPYWQIIETPVTDELRRWAYERSAAYVRAQKADKALNAKATNPGNYSFTGGPRFDGLCSDCPWSPSMGGPCLIVNREVVA